MKSLIYTVCLGCSLSLLATLHAAETTAPKPEQPKTESKDTSTPKKDQTAKASPQTALEKEKPVVKTPEKKDEKKDVSPKKQDKQETFKSEKKSKPTSTKGNTGEELLNLATEIKLSATNILDFNKVILLCEKAEEKGLTGEYAEFCRQLKNSTRMQRGLALTKQIFDQQDQLSAMQAAKIASNRKIIMEDLELALKELPDQAAVWLAYGRMNMLPQGNNEKAIESFDKAIQFGQEEPIILAQALRFRGELENNNTKKIEFFKKSLKVFPDNPDVHHLIADYWFKIKNYKDALESINKALELNSSNDAYKKTKAYILAALDRNDEAEKVFNDTLEQQSKSLLSQIEKAQFFYGIGKHQEAINVMTDLIKTNQQPILYYFRAMFLSREKKFKEAIEDINVCLKHDPKFYDAFQLKAVIYLQMEKYDNAIDLFRMILMNNPEFEGIITQIAYAQAKKGDWNASMKTLAAELKKKPDDFELLRCRGDIELMYGKFKEAIATYDKLLKLNPSDSGVLNNYSWLLSTSPEDSVRNGKKALEYGLKASELSFYAEAHILSTLGAAYAELGDFDNAQKWSKKAVDLAEKEHHERLDDLKKELESYQQKKPWREVPEKLRDPKKTEPKNQPKTGK